MKLKVPSWDWHEECPYVTDWRCDDDEGEIHERNDK